MKNTLVAFFGTVSILASASAMADKPGSDWISIEQAIEKARGLGYTIIREIEADDGYWEGQGYKKDGEDYEFRLNGKTGEVEKDERD